VSVSGADDARARLRFHLELQDGFWFAAVAADDARAREALRAEAAAWAEGEGVPFRVHAPAEGLAATLVRDAEPGLHWVVMDPEAEEAAGRLLMALNERREALRKRLPGGLIVEGGARLKVLLRNLAPDLFSIRACVLEPAGAAGGVRSETPWWVGELGFDHAEVRRWGQPAVPWVDGDAARRALDEARRLEGHAGAGARRSELDAVARAVEALLAQGWIGEAAPVAERMLALAEDLVGADGPPPDGFPAVTAPDAWARGMLAEACEASAVVAHAQGDLPGARDLWRRGLGLRQGLAGEGPIDAARAPRVAEVAEAWSHLGELAWQAGDEDEAERSLDEALALRKSLVEAAPSPERIGELAISWSLLGDLRLDRGEVDAALAAYDEALRLRRDLVAEASGDRRKQALLAVVLGRRAAALGAAEERRAAREAAEESLRLIEAVAEADPATVHWQVWRATGWSRLGDTLLGLGDVDGAEEAWETAVELRRDLCREDPENARWAQDLAGDLGRLAEVALLAGEIEEAEMHAGEALEIAEPLGWEDPSNARWWIGLAWARVVASEVAAARDEDEESERLLEAAREAHARAVALGVRGRRAEVLAERLREAPPV